MDRPYRDNTTQKTHHAGSSQNVPVNPRRKFRRRGTGDNSAPPEIYDSEDEEKSVMSDSSEHELDAFDSDDDVESGLPTEERRKFLQKQRRRNDLESRIAGVAGRLSQEEKKEADKNVLRKLGANAVLIGLWYFFSLSISLVSLKVSVIGICVLTTATVQQVDVLVRQSELPLSSLHH